MQSKSLCELILSNSRDKNDEHKKQSSPIDKYYNDKMTLLSRTTLTNRFSFYEI